jgi:hypothetical protein
VTSKRRGAQSTAAAALLALCLGLGACGDSDDSTTSGAPSARDSLSTTRGQATAPGAEAVKGAGGAARGGRKAAGPGGSGSTGRSGRSAITEEAAIPPPLKHKAGNAASFLNPHGDNSIPTYGSEASSSQQAAATASLRDYLDARARGEWGGACQLMGAPLQKQVRGLAAGPDLDSVTCAAAYAEISSGTSAAERASPLTGHLAAFRVDGESAFALFYGSGNQQYMIPMVSEMGTWKVNQIAPIPYPPGVRLGQ